MAALDTSTLLTIGAIGIILATVLFIVGVLYNSLILWLVSKIFKLKDTKFRTAFLAALIAAAVNFAVSLVLRLGSGTLTGGMATTGGMIATGLLIGLAGVTATYVVNSLTAMKLYKLEAGKSFLVGFVWTVISFAVAFVVGIIISVIFAAVLMGSGTLLRP